MSNVGSALARSGRVSAVFLPMSDMPSESELLLRAIFERSPDAMVIASDDALFIEVNAAAVALLGVDRGALTTMHLADLAPVADRPAARAAWDQLLREGTQEGLWSFVRPDGERRVVEYKATAHLLPGRHLTILRDVTERQRLAEARAMIATVADAAGDALIGFGTDGRITYWSRSCERVFGYSAAEALGMKARALIPPDAAGEYDMIVAAMRRGETRQLRDVVRLHKSGTRITVSASYAPIMRDGALQGMSIVVRDGADRVEDRLALTDRLATAGTLAAGIAHEINNPLAALIANLEHVAAAVAHDHGLREPLTDARAGALRIREIVRDLRFLANPGDATRSPLDVCAVLQSTVRVAAQEIRARARLVEDYQPVPAVDASAARLGQVFVNLIINATQAIPEGAADRHEIFVGTHTDPAGRAVVTVRDTGAGIAADHVGRIFDPFFTTRPVGVGAGLGLAIAHRLVTELGGDIRVQSVSGAGSTFEVTLPPSSAAPRPRDEPPPVIATAARGRILVIDDEPIVGRAVRRVLQQAHDVTAVTSARAALDLIEGGERYHLILCDLMMPHMTGMELHEHLTAALPEVAERMVFLTGGAFTPAARNFLDRTSNRCFEKPFDADQLRQLAAQSVVT